MKKIAVIVSLCCSTLSMNSHASTQSTDVVRAVMQKEGFILGVGVTLIPVEKIIAPNDIKSLWVAAQPNQNNLNSLWQSEQPNQKENNYQSIYSERAEELLQINETVQGNYQYNADNTNPNSAVLRKSISEINMAYPAISVARADVSKHYGFAACGTFNHGWTGVAEFFQKEKLGSCAYTEYNFALAHATAKVDEKNVRDDVNHKVTTIHVEGNKDSGYVYTVAWMDEQYYRTLECANKHDAPDMITDVIALAQRIDNQ